MLRQLPFMLALVALVLAVPPAGARVAAAVTRVSRPLVRRPGVAIALLVVAALSLAAAVSLFVFMPLPRIADEFSHLLAADTFRHGRLTNPTHPAWRSFETFHVLQQPTYMSRYSPAPDLLLALGWIATGLPIAGAWLAYALAVAAVAWMLLAFVPRRWALTGGLLVAIHPAIFAWSQSYWGGAVAALGGALLAGAAARLRRREDLAASALGGAGLFLLANSRPYEGFAFALILVGWLVAGRVKRAGWSPARHVALIPLVLLGAATVVFVAHYNARVTGSALTLPHRAYGLQYAPSPLFVWGTPRPAPEYRHEVMRSYHLGGEMDAYRLQSTAAGKLAALRGKIVLLAEEAFALPLAFAPGQAPAYSWLPLAMLAGLPFAFRTSAKSRSAALLFALFVAAACLVLWMQPHYAAPGVCFAVLLVVDSLRGLRARWRRSMVPRAFTIAAVVLVAASLAASVAMIPGQYMGHFSGAVTRDRIAGDLRAMPGRDLVIVRYAPGHYVHFEWVWNEADIDAAEVVWAREASADVNMTLLERMRGRRVWLLEADLTPPRLTEVRVATDAGGDAPRVR